MKYSVPGQWGAIIKCEAPACPWERRRSRQPT